MGSGGDMDYGDILKRAWNVTWRYKVLWVLGFFAGAGAGAGGGGNSGTGYRSGSSQSFTAADYNNAMRVVQQNIGVIVLAAVAVLLVGLVLFVISIAARGGLIHLVNEAEEGREVRLGAGWRVGFRKWGRVFGIEFLAGLPVFVLVLVIAGVIGAGVVAAIRAGGSAQALQRVLGGMLVGACCFLFVFVVLLIVLGVIFGIVAALALRYAVIEDRHVMDSLKQSWNDLWSKRGAFVMYLIQLGIGIAFGVAVAIVALVLVVPGVLLIAAGAWPVGALMTFVAGLLLLVPGAVYATFYHAAWTVFFRRMTGLQPSPAAVALAGYPVPYPPAPSAPMEPPAPPASPAPVAPAPPAPPVSRAPEEPSGPADA